MVNNYLKTDISILDALNEPLYDKSAKSHWPDAQIQPLAKSALKSSMNTLLSLYLAWIFISSIG